MGAAGRTDASLLRCGRGGADGSDRAGRDQTGQRTLRAGQPGRPEERGPMTKQKKTLTRAESMDDEARTLAASADFRSLLNEGRTAPATPLEQLDRRRPVSAEDRRLADEY